MDTVDCPYCGQENEINHDDGAHYDEEHAESMECEHCDKKFLVDATISWYFEGREADCLNDGEHKWKDLISTHPVGREYCTHCRIKRNKAI